MEAVGHHRGPEYRIWIEGRRSEDVVQVGNALAGLIACRCYAPVPLSSNCYGRDLNSPGTWSPGPSTNARLKQQVACIPTQSLARGKPSESPRQSITHLNDSELLQIPEPV